MANSHSSFRTAFGNVDYDWNKKRLSACETYNALSEPYKEYAQRTCQSLKTWLAEYKVIKACFPP